MKTSPQGSEGCYIMLDREEVHLICEAADEAREALVTNFHISHFEDTVLSSAYSNKEVIQMIQLCNGGYVSYNSDGFYVQVPSGDSISIPIEILKKILREDQLDALRIEGLMEYSRRREILEIESNIQYNEKVLRTTLRSVVDLIHHRLMYIHTLGPKR